MCQSLIEWCKVWVLHHILTKFSLKKKKISCDILWSVAYHFYINLLISFFRHGQLVVKMGQLVVKMDV